MLKLTKTGIGLLTKQYRSVLRKCVLLNLGLFVATTILVTMTPKMGRTAPGIVTEGEIDQYAETNIYKLYYAKYMRASSRDSYLDVETSYTNSGTAGKYFDLEIFLTDLSMGHLFKAGAISSHDIANGTIVNEDIADSTIMKAKLSSAVRTSLSLADTAVQSGANISIFNNDAGFITKSVNDLTNYYTKSETYSRNEIANLDSLNYYYTFRDDKISETTEFALFLDNEKLSNVFEA